MLDKVGNVTLLEYVYHRCKTSKLANKVIVITSTDKSDDALYDLCLDKEIPLFRGDLNNVLERYICAANENKIELICRVCGDSPFVDVTAIDEMFSLFNNATKYDYISTSNSLNGFTSEVVLQSVLKNIQTKNLTDDDKEHVTKYILDNKVNFKTKFMNLNLKPITLEPYSLTVDYPDDMSIANKIVSKLDG